jgi:putative iron-regulated protein
MIGEENEAGNAVVERVIDALLDQTKSLERAVATLDLKAIEFEGSTSLDSPNKIEEEYKAEGTKGAEAR